MLGVFVCGVVWTAFAVGFMVMSARALERYDGYWV